MKSIIIQGDIFQSKTSTQICLYASDLQPFLKLSYYVNISKDLKQWNVPREHDVWQIVEGANMHEYTYCVEKNSIVILY